MQDIIKLSIQCTLVSFKSLYRNTLKIIPVVISSQKILRFSITMQIII